MPDASGPIAPDASTRRPRWVSPMLRRVLLVNFIPLALLVAALLYFDQYQDGLLEGEVQALREQARIYAAALGESAVEPGDPASPELDPDLARPLLRRLTDPSPNVLARLYAPDGALVADSRQRQGPGGALTTDPLPSPPPRAPLAGWLGRASDSLLRLLRGERPPTIDIAQNAPGPDWQPDVRQEVRLNSADDSREMPPFIRRTTDDRLLVTVAEPVERDRHTIGIVLLTRDAREVDQSLSAVRLSIMALFSLALVLTVLLSWYLSLTIARPLLRLTLAARDMREGHGRAGSVPPPLLRRRDEIGELGQALSETASALWARMDATERFAADVAHEIKNPLTSIRSAIETLPRIEDGTQRHRLLGIIGDDVTRLDRLITDISDASRLDAELSRSVAEPIDVLPILAMLAELAAATRRPNDPVLVLDAPAERLCVRAVEGRLVQVLRNLIANAQSFSPRNGRIWLRARETGAVVELIVDDEGPGLPDARLEHVFDRFYSERPAGETFGRHSGLGLSISRQIVEALHGRIAAENRRDAEGQIVGARFVVRLPKA